MKCSQCGRTHAHQKIDFPLGSTVVVENEFAGGIDIARYDPTKSYQEAARIMIPQGSLGRVVGHCDDGRALIEFEAEKGRGNASHSFHHPEGYFQRGIVVLQEEIDEN